MQKGNTESEELFQLNKLRMMVKNNNKDTLREKIRRYIML